MTPTAPPVPGERPSEQAAALVEWARALTEHSARTSADRQLLEWAAAWADVRLDVRACHACGKHAHTTHLGAAQHAAYEVLHGGAPSLRIYRCRQGEVLHVGHRTSRARARRRAAETTPPPEPEPPSPVQVAAGQLLELCATELAERGERGTQERIAEVLGTRQSQLSDVRRGREGQGSLDLLARWAERWEAAGYGRLRLVVEPGSARVERAE